MDQLSLSSSTPLEEILERVCILLEAGGTYQMEDVDNDSEEEEEEDGFDGYYYGDDDDVDREAISDKRSAFNHSPLKHKVKGQKFLLQ